jgi:hypothetical protein
MARRKGYIKHPLLIASSFLNFFIHPSSAESTNLVRPLEISPRFPAGVCASADYRMDPNNFLNLSGEEDVAIEETTWGQMIQFLVRVGLFGDFFFT